VFEKRIIKEEGRGKREEVMKHKSTLEAKS
jgi:hypothetical protein